MSKPLPSREKLLEMIADLDGRIETLDVERAPIRQQMGNLDRTHSKLCQERAELRKQLTDRNATPRVSDHAVVRYLERKHGFDFETARAELLTPVVLAAMEHGAESVKALGGQLRLKGRTIVTFVS